jgi:hypothetical protein
VVFLGTPNNLARPIHAKGYQRGIYLCAPGYFMDYWHLDLAFGAKQRSQEKLEPLYETAAQSVDLTDVF